MTLCARHACTISYARHNLMPLLNDLIWFEHILLFDGKQKD